MKRIELFAVAAVLLLATPAQAQRVEDGRVDLPPVHRDTTRPSPEGIFVRRAVQSSTTALMAVVPFALYAMQQDGPSSETLLFTGSLSYVAAATWGAARRGSRNCSFGQRLWRASGGALAGMAASASLWHIATDGEGYYSHHFNDARGQITAASLVIGVPLGAAAVLYTCR